MTEDFVQRGKELILRKEFQEAVRVCRLGLLGRPNQVEGRLLLATALLSLGRLDEVLGEMRVALEHDKDNVLAHLIKGEAMMRKGDSRQAQEVFARVVELDPENALGQRNLGLARARTEERHSAPADEDRDWRAATPPVEISSEDVVDTEHAREAALDEIAAQQPRRATTTTELDELLDELQAASARPPSDPVPVAVVDQAEGPTSVGVVVPEPPDAEGPRQRRTTAADRPSVLKRRMWPFALLGVAALAGAVWGGLALVSQRRDERLRDRLTRARGEAAAQTVAAFRSAEDDLVELLREDDRPDVRAALLKLRATARAELGVGEGPIEDPHAAGPDAKKAAVYLALGTPAAVDLARALPADAEASYLLGRALGPTREAIAALEVAVRDGPTPLAWTALGEARAELGPPEAAADAFAHALALAPGHPTAIVARARFQARARALPDRPDPETALEGILAEGRGAVSERQAALAALALAEVDLARGDLARAQEALAAGPRAPDPRVEEGRALAFLALGDTSAARAEAEQAAPRHPEAHLWLAEVALAEKQPEAAAAELGRAGVASAGVRGRRVAAEIALARGDLAAAAAALDEALKLRPADPRARLLRAEVDVRRNDPGAAHSRLESLYREGHDPLVGTALADVLRRLGEHAAARGVIDEVLPHLSQEQGELPGRAHLVAARLYREEGRFAEAQKEYAAALAARPKNRDARLEAAMLAYDMGNSTVARLGLDALLADLPGDPEVLLAAARIRCETDDPAGAQRLIDAAARKGAAKGDVLRESGRAALAAGRAKEAAGRLASAVKAKPDDGGAHLLLIEALVQAKAFPDAQREADETRKAFPDSAVGELARGRLGLLRGDGTEAIAGYAAAARRLESGPPRERAAALLGLGRGLVLTGKLDGATEAFRKAGELDAGAEPRVELGRVLAANRDLPGAADALADAVKREPGRADAWFLLGDVELKRRRKAAARAALTQCLKLDPRGPDAAAARKLLRAAR